MSSNPRPTRPPEFRLDWTGRYRRGTGWSALFLTVTLLSVFFLATLIWTIVNDSFGYVILVNETDPVSLARDGKTLEELDAAGLVAVLEENLPGRRLRSLGNENPLAERSREDLYAIVMTEVVNPEVKATFDLSESILGRESILEILEQDYPDGTLIFRSWLNLDFLRAAQSSVAIAAISAGGAASGRSCLFACTMSGRGRPRWRIIATSRP